MACPVPHRGSRHWPGVSEPCPYADSHALMIHNRYLPRWVHRLCNGLLGAALCAGIASIGIGQRPDSWIHVGSRWLLLASVPVGVILAAVAHRLSIVEGVAGGDGYDKLHDTNDHKPSA